MLQTVRAEKVYEKNGVICLVSMSPFCPALSKKSRFIKVVYIFASEVSCYGLSENGIVYYAITYCFGNIRV